MGYLLLLLVIGGAVTAFLWFRQKTATMAESQPPSNRFHAVTIRFRQDACPAVQALANTRFLAKEAPRLPLDECTVPTCRCQYKHYDDRRDNEDRREEPTGTRFVGEQRRHAREDRRKS